MKKISMTALIKAVKQNYLLNECKIVERTLKDLVIVYHNKTIIHFEIFGSKHEYIGFDVEGYTNYIVCEELINIMKGLEKWLT